MPIYFGDEGAAGKLFNQTAFIGLRRLWHDMGRKVTATTPADFAAAAKEIVRIDREEPAWIGRQRSQHIIQMLLATSSTRVSIPRF